MDSQKLLYEQRMVAEAAAAGFCRPPREKRPEYYGKSAQAKRDCYRGLDYKKFMDEQHAIEQAEAVGFCVPIRDSSKISSTPQWDLRSRTTSMDERRITCKDLWRGSGDAPTTEFSNATSRVSTESRSRSNGDEDDEADDDDDENEEASLNPSDERILLHNPFNTKTSASEPLTSSIMKVVSRCSSQVACRTDSSSPCSAMVADKQPSHPDIPQDKTRDDGMPVFKVAAIAFVYGLLLFIVAELLFQSYGRNRCEAEPPKRAKHSLLRILFEDIMYFAVRHFRSNYRPGE